MYTGALWVWIVCCQMVMTPPHNPMQLYQNPINIAYATGAISVCRYIPFETNCTVYKSWLIFGNLSIIYVTKFSTEVVLCTFSITHCIFTVSAVNLGLCHKNVTKTGSCLLRTTHTHTHTHTNYCIVFSYFNNS